MKAHEFISRNQDVLIAPLSEADYQNLTDGTVIFQIACFKGKLAKAERTIRSAGYQMVAATSRDTAGRMESVSTLSLTSNGYAKLDYILPADIADSGTKILYHCKPLPLNDARRNHHWQIT